MRKVNGFYGGSNEDGTGTGTLTVANSNGNSVVSGDSLSSATAGTGAALVFDNTISMFGSTFVIRSSVGATSAASVFGFAVTATTASQVAWGFRTSDNTVARMIAQFRSGGATQYARVTQSATGKVELRNGANTIVATSTTTLANNTNYRLKAEINTGTSATSFVHIYAADDATLLETISATSNFTAGSIDEVRFGSGVATTNVPSAYFAAIVASDEGLPGAWVGSVTLTPAGITLTAIGLTAVPHPVNVALTPATLVLQAVTLTAVPQPVSVALTPASMALSPLPLSPVPQPVTVNLQPVSMVLAALALLPQPGAVNVNLTPAILNLAAIALDPQGIAPVEYSGTWGIKAGM